MENLKAISSTINPRARGQSVSNAASIPFIIHDARDDSIQNGNY